MKKTSVAFRSQSIGAGPPLTGIFAWIVGINDTRGGLFEKFRVQKQIFGRKAAKSRGEIFLYHWLGSARGSAPPGPSSMSNNLYRQENQMKSNPDS